jgi:predicted  nucleic acid-binding Zn-ribbon protein
MPHQCVRCNALYPDGANEILKGCKCGAKLFFFIRKQNLEEGKELLTKLTREEKIQVEEDVRELIGAQQEPDKPVILDLESIRILKPGKYELDLVHLFKKDPLVFKLEEGKYMIDLPQAFGRKREE